MAMADSIFLWNRKRGSDWSTLNHFRCSIKRNRWFRAFAQLSTYGIAEYHGTSDGSFPQQSTRTPTLFPWFYSLTQFRGRREREGERESLEARGRGGWKREKEEEAAGSHGGNWEVQTFTVMRRRFEWGFLAWQQLVAEKKPPLDEFLRNLRVRFYRFTITRWQQLSETLFFPSFTVPRPLLTERKSSKLFEHTVPLLLPFPWMGRGMENWKNSRQIEIKRSRFFFSN